MQKSKFLSFIFGMIPGAGQMYLGYMKRGVSLMAMFWLVLGVSSALYISHINVLLPIIWFYAFFDTLNLYGMSYDRYNVQDDYLFHLSQLAPLRNALANGRTYKLGGICCILLGLYMLYNTLLANFIYELFPSLYQILRRLPTIIIALAIIWFGVALITGKHLRPHLLQEDFKEYKNHDEQ